MFDFIRLINRDVFVILQKTILKCYQDINQLHCELKSWEETDMSLNMYIGTSRITFKIPPGNVLISINI